MKKNVYIHPSANIAAGVIFTGTATVGPNCIIQKECDIGDKVVIDANCVIGPHIHLGRGCHILPCCYVDSNVPEYAIVSGGCGKVTGYIGSVSVHPESTMEPVCGQTGAQKIVIPTFSDLRGALGVVEWSTILPFEVTRMFFTYHVPTTEVRGSHAHKQCEQFLIALNGYLHVITDNGIIREEFILDSPKQGLLLPAGVWGIQYKHSENCILLVLASLPYDASDYIRSYDEYLEYIKAK